MYLNKKKYDKKLNDEYRALKAMGVTQIGGRDFRTFSEYIYVRGMKMDYDFEMLSKKLKELES